MEREEYIMNEMMKAELKSKIDKAGLVSFDIFDTLLFRKTNTPETVFDLVGKHFGIVGFRKLRMDMQNEASRRAWEAYQHPHADMDQIYEVLAEHTEYPVDWMEVKEYEIQMEKDALVANRELLDIFHYAKAQGKRVVAVSDMYLFADTLWDILKERGYEDIDHVYCSADERKAKFNKQLFARVAEAENIPPEQILHIGDKARDDGEYPAEFGWQTFVYNRECDLEKLRNALSSDVDKGIYKILCNGERSFWYQLGVEVGGPVYMALFRHLLQIKQQMGCRKIFFLSRDGYKLYHIFKWYGIDDVEYLYTSRRALLLACITEMNEDDIDSLPPYSYGQTVGEILDYLCVEREKIGHLEEAGLTSMDMVITNLKDAKKFKKLYTLNKEVFLERCRVERENALKYYSQIGLLDEDAICFDCGWQGSSQLLLENFKKAVGCDKKHFFVYFGIKNGDKSRKQLKGMHYDAYLFDFYRNYSLQEDLRLNVVMYEQLFSAPHESVFYYGEDGQVVFEDGQGSHEKEELLEGIWDFISVGIDFVDKYDVEYTPEIAVGHLKRLIHFPTEEEAVTIGNMQNVDGFARQRGENQHIAYITRQQLDKKQSLQVYWPAGLFKRPDIPEDIKKECAERLDVQYPEVIPEYHLEAEQSIRNFHRWIHWDEKRDMTPVQLAYKPMFSVVIPVYNTVTEQLEECIQSVLAQNYDNFQLILVDDHSTWDNVRPVLGKYEADPRVQVIYRAVNGHISIATNDGIAAAKGDFIVFMDCDDVIEPDALMEFAKKLNQNQELDFIYSDEDKITEDGKIRHMPFFKPDWSPDLFLNMMYTNHLATYRTSIVREVGGLRTAFNGSQDYDFTLRFMEKSHNSRVGHVNKILYHWRERKESVAYAMNSKNYASDAARYAKEDLIRRTGMKARLEVITGMNQYRMVYDVVGDPLVSIIIPSKDHPEILKQCIDSIRDFTRYSRYEIVVVDNGSKPENRRLISAYLESVGAKYIYQEEKFNFSAMCNRGAAQAEGEYLLFLNDDIEIFQPDWLERMLGHAQQKHTGAVGAKLFYPGKTLLQHSGVSNPVDGPLHSFLGLDDQYPYYFGWNRVDNNCIAVTGACLMLSQEKFAEVGGFDENYPVAYNDVKLCFALHEKGYYNVIRNDVAAYHHESLSRGTDLLDDKKLLRMNRERARLFAEFPALRNRDPFLSSHIHRLMEPAELKRSYEELADINLDGVQQVFTGAVDMINTTADRVCLRGWSSLEGETHMEQLQRQLVFQDPYGRTFGARALPLSRPDVAEYFDKPEYLTAGFECVLSKSDLRVDVMPYSMGILTTGRDGVRYVCWCGQTKVDRNGQNHPIPAEFQKLDSFQLHENAEDIQRNLDECDNEDGVIRIHGFAFRHGKEHVYYRNSIVLVDENGSAFEFDVQPVERLDVASAFPAEHFLRYTGFLCYIFEGVLEAGREYDVIIRLRNRFDPADIRDVVTGRKVVG